MDEEVDELVDNWSTPIFSLLGGPEGPKAPDKARD